MSLTAEAIKFNIGDITLCTESEGPYKRLVIWFQGCTLGCSKCGNPEYLSLKPKHIVSLDDLIQVIHQSKTTNDIEGVTLLGGEPTDQQHLGVLCKEIAKLDLGIILFTGREINELGTEIIDEVDMIIDGPYQNSVPDQTRRLIGSINQNIHYITDRYKAVSSWFTKKTESRDINVQETTISIIGEHFTK